MITVSNLHSSVSKIPSKYKEDIPTILDAIKNKLHVKDKEVNFVIEEILKQINIELVRPKTTPAKKPTPVTPIWEKHFAQFKREDVTSKWEDKTKRRLEYYIENKFVGYSLYDDLNNVGLRNIYNYIVENHKLPNVQKKAKKTTKPTPTPAVKKATTTKKQVVTKKTNGQEKAKETTKTAAEPKPKFEIGTSVKQCNFCMEAKILSFRINRKKEIVYKCKYVAPINEIFEAKENELELFKEVKATPVKEKTESNNPKPFAIKPKSVSVATAINDILGLEKYKKAKPLIANLIYNKFKNESDLDNEDLTVNLTSNYELGLLKNDSVLHTFESWNDDVSLTPLGVNFVKAVNGRIESLRNQKTNYAMFDNLAGAKKIDTKKYPLSIIKKDFPLKTKIKLNSSVASKNKFGTIVGHAYADRITNYDYPFEVIVLFDNETKPEPIKPFLFSIVKTKKPKPLKGVGIISNVIGNVIASSVLGNPAKNSIAAQMKQRANQKQEYYIVPDRDIANFLGKIEKKQKESVAITITGGQGSMKTRFCFQLMNTLAQNYKVGHASIEEHPQSTLYYDKVHQYLNNKAMHNVSAPEINSIDDVHKLCRENDVIVTDSFSKLQEMQRGCELDKDFRKRYDGKLFIIIYQLTSDGKMRGGAKSQFDGDIIGYIKKEPNYKDNYCYWDKNRYQSKNLEDLKFNIYSGKLQSNEQEPEPQNELEFSFNVK
jgi:hypothetical protein